MNPTTIRAARKRRAVARLAPPARRAEGPGRLAVAGAMLAGVAVAAALAWAIPWACEAAARAILPGADVAMPGWVESVLVALYVLFVATTLLPFAELSALALVHRRRRPASSAGAARPLPFVSVILPALDEGEHVERALEAALAQDYPRFEVLLVDDGSSDLTALCAERLDVRVIRHATNRGKAAALNSGLAAARGEVVVTSDADSVLSKDAVSRLVEALEADGGAGAVAGRVEVGRTDTLWRRFQAMEYVLGQSVVKKAQSVSAGSVIVAPGPVTAFRREAIERIGGFKTRTITEDFDATLDLLEAGYRVSYEPRASASTDAPRDRASLRSQRLRWYRGGLQTILGHRSMMFSRRHGGVGIGWLPYSLVFGYGSVLLTGFLLLAVPVLAVGSGDPLRFLEVLSLYALVILAIDGTLNLLAVSLHEERRFRALWITVLLPLYKFFIDAVKTRAVLAEWRRKRAAWDG